MSSLLDAKKQKILHTHPPTLPSLCFPHCPSGLVSPLRSFSLPGLYLNLTCVHSIPDFRDAISLSHSL